MAVDVKEYSAFTGITEGYAEEILKNEEYAKWYIPSGAAKLEKAAELIADIESAGSLEDFLEMIKAGGDVILKGNIEVPEMITISNEVVLDLNGYSITKTSTTASGKNVLFYVTGDGAKLTITGDGDVNVKSGKADIAVWSDPDAEVNIESGNFYGTGNPGGSDLIYAKNGKINVSGGSFKLDTMTEKGFAEPQYSLLNAYGANVNTAKDFIVVTGGTFYGFNPADNVSEGVGTSFVADGYKATENPTGVWTVSKVEMVDNGNGDNLNASTEGVTETDPDGGSVEGEE